MRTTQPEPIYAWERRSEYAWNNEFARNIGRLLAMLPKRYHILLHNLAGQATLISNCIAMGNRDPDPGECVPPAELHAYRFIGWHATTAVDRILADLSRTTSLGKQEVARCKALMEKIRHEFEVGLHELDAAAPLDH